MTAQTDSDSPRSHALFTFCLWRCVCTRVLIGYAHLLARGWQEVKQMPVPYFVVCVFPEVQSEQLEGGEHGPTKMVKPCEAVVWVITDATKARVVGGTIPEMYCKHQQMLCSNSYLIFHGLSSVKVVSGQNVFLKFRCVQFDEFLF